MERSVVLSRGRPGECNGLGSHKAVDACCHVSLHGRCIEKGMPKTANVDVVVMCAERHFEIFMPSTFSRPNDLRSKFMVLMGYI